VMLRSAQWRKVSLPSCLVSEQIALSSVRDLCLHVSASVVWSPFLSAVLNMQHWHDFESNNTLCVGHIGRPHWTTSTTNKCVVVKKNMFSVCLCSVRVVVAVNTWKTPAFERTAISAGNGFGSRHSVSASFQPYQVFQIWPSTDSASRAVAVVVQHRGRSSGQR